MHSFAVYLETDVVIAIVSTRLVCKTLSCRFGQVIVVKGPTSSRGHHQLRDVQQMPFHRATTPTSTATATKGFQDEAQRTRQMKRRGSF